MKASHIILGLENYERGTENQGPLYEIASHSVFQIHASVNLVPYLQSPEQLYWGPSMKAIITRILHWKILTHTQTKILIQSVNYCSGQEDYAKEAIRFVRALQCDRTATKEVSGRHSHFGHPYGARVQFRDALVCLVTTFPNSIILQQHYQKKLAWLYTKPMFFPLASQQNQTPGGN